MKKIFTLLFAVTNALFASAQWSNTTNQFTDDMHMPVCTETGDQGNAITINSYPDGGHFFIWEDKRGGFYSVTQIFAQKYDKDGNRLWAPGGVVISSSTNEQKFSFTNSNADYRTYSYGASDGAGGLYLTYTDDSVSTYAWYRIIVQHVQPNGTVVFPGPGYIVAQTEAGQAYNFSAPQLIADDDGGFYVSYSRNTNENYIYVYCYKDIAGAMTIRGGGLVNENGVQQTTPVGCVGASKFYIDKVGTTVSAYNIWPDLQGGCSVLMSMNGNTGSQGKMLCYNRVWKAKKNTTVTIATQYPTGDPNTNVINYAKGDIDILYKFSHNLLNRNCTAPSGYTVWVDDDLYSVGYLVVDQGKYDYNYPKGTTVSTSGNINVELLACETRNYDVASNTVTPFIIQGIGLSSEKYDDVPYQRASNNNPISGYNTNPPAGLNTLDAFRDTLLTTSVYYYEFSLAAGANQIYAAALINEPGQDFHERSVRLQHLSVERQSTTNFAIQYKTSDNKGTKIGSEIYTGFQGSGISYEFPLLTANTTGNALFYIREYGRYIRVSPILTGAELAWGAMGKPIGTPVINGGYANPDLPFASLDPVNGTGVITWQDARNFIPASGLNIFMRHLDDLNVADYLPANKKIQLLSNGANLANPILLTGSSKKFSTIEAYNPSTGTTSPVVEILDNYNLGAIPVNVYENTVGPIRTTNGKPYLNRNYTITPQNNPAGAADITVRLFFTTAEFDALKTADPTIANPGSLSVIKQSNPGGTVPAEYIPTGAETEIIPSAWMAVDGGYYVELTVKSFSNFFIQKTSGALPVKWLGVQAQWVDSKNAKISWQVAEQQNVNDYTVQQSDDGLVFNNACNVTATAITSYNCTVPSKNNTVNYYRVLQRDIDNKFTYSKTVILNPSAAISLAIHPNPVKDMLYIDGLAGYSTLKITGVNGNIIQQQNVVSGMKYIDISRLKSGMYLLTVQGSRETQTLKFVKQ